MRTTSERPEPRRTTPRAGRAGAERATAAGERTAEIGQAPGRDGLPASLAALQRSAGNAAVARVVEERRATTSHAGPAGVIQRASDDEDTTAPEAITAEEHQLIVDYRNETTDETVIRLLDELLGYLRQGTVGFDGRPGQGYTQAHGDGTYTVHYEIPESNADRVALLVHELTHVAIGEAYDSTMLNLPVPQLDAAQQEQAFDGVPKNGREAAEQEARLRLADRAGKNAFIDYVTANVQALTGLLPGAGLSDQLQKDIRAKLKDHTAPKPFHEYDAVLSHILAWCDQYDGTDRSSPFYLKLTSLVAEAQGWRQSKAVTLPDNAPASAPGPSSAGGAASGGPGRPKRGGGLWKRVKAILRKLTRRR